MPNDSVAVGHHVAGDEAKARASSRTLRGPLSPGDHSWPSACAGVLPSSRSRGRANRRRTPMSLYPRLLILPWITIPNLGSHILSLHRQQLPQHWTERYSTTPVLTRYSVSGKRSSYMFTACFFVAVRSFQSTRLASSRRPTPCRLRFAPFEKK